jgi:coproporphyrinogen III oxidase-like Fe-S oxidoreductase
MIFNFPSQTEQMLHRDIELLKESGCNQTTFYPLMASPAVARSLARTVGAVDYDRERAYYDIIAEGLSDTFEPASAWTFSRIAGGMIDEYILDYEQYVGVGSGAFSFLEGGLFIETFSPRDYEAAIAAGRTGVTSYRRFPRVGQMRYRFLMELFGLSLDKKKFREDFGVSVERALPIEMTFMRANHAFAGETADEVRLTQKGRYLLVAMMRQFFIGVNHVRDQARSALSTEERTLLFGGVDGEADARVSPGCSPGDPVFQAAHETETAADLLPPVGPRA